MQKNHANQNKGGKNMYEKMLKLIIHIFYAIAYYVFSVINFFIFQIVKKIQSGALLKMKINEE